MDCHINCHGELNMLVAIAPILLGAVRVAWTRIKRRLLGRTK